MADIRVSQIDDEDIVALHVAALILRDKAGETCSDTQKHRLLAYAEGLDGLIQFGFYIPESVAK